MVEPGSGLGSQWANEVAEGPVARRSAAEKHGVDVVVGKVDVRHANIAIHHLVGVVVVEQHDAVGADQFDPCGVSECREFRGERVADTEVDCRAVVVAQHRPREVVGGVARLSEDATLPDRTDLDELVAFEKPVHQVDVVSERVDDRRCIGIARQHRQRLRPRVVNAGSRADEVSEAILDDLFLGDLVAPPITAAVTDPEFSSAVRGRSDDEVGVFQRECDRFFDEHILAGPQCVQHGVGVFPFARGDDHRVDVGVIDDFLIVARPVIRPDLAREITRGIDFTIGDREEPDRGVLRRKTCAQRSDSSGPDDREPDLSTHDDIIHNVGCSV
jgi:desulfoferrodoxin (superoxide reductase-like protein)